MKYPLLLLSLIYTFATAPVLAQMPPTDDDFGPPFDGPMGGGFRPRFGPPGGGGGGPSRHMTRPSTTPAAQQPNQSIINTLTPKQKLQTFNNNVRVSLSDKFIEVYSTGIPNHQTGNFPNEYNPNSILYQNYHFRIPLQPQFADRNSALPFGPIGVAINGIPFYNPYNAQGRDAVFGPNAEVFDSCCGHPDPGGRYHYHKYPVCLNSPFRDPAGKHSPLIGWAFDGFAIYGPNGETGVPPTDLDSCNGHIDLVHGYHYHVTKNFPYVLGAYRGTVELSNFDGPVFGR